MEVGVGKGIGRGNVRATSRRKRWAVEKSLRAYEIESLNMVIHMSGMKSREFARGTINDGFSRLGGPALTQIAKLVFI